MPESLRIDWFVSDRIGVLDGRNPADSPEVARELECQGFTQIVTVRPWPFTMAWRLPDSSLRNFMVRAKGASGLSSGDLSGLNEFCLYELAHGRRAPLWFENRAVQEIVTDSISCFFKPGLSSLDEFLHRMMASQAQRAAKRPPEPHRPTGCRYCHDGICHGDIVCHTTTAESATAIIRSGRILSACRARGASPEEMARDPRNAAGDPPDYFEYVMWGPGNCTAVDKLVFERTVEHVPSWEEFEVGFQPGVRFFFRSSNLRSHPGFTLDGIHEKIHGELELDPWLIMVAIPEGLPGSEELITLANDRLTPDKVVSFSFRGMHYRDWARLVYGEAKRIS